MKDNARISESVAAVVGRVCIDYFDPVTEKVKERVAGKNHIFEDSFKCSFWSNIINNRTATRPQLFLTDDNTPPDDEFPYLRGNILGWGGINVPLSGARQGQWMLTGTGASWLEQPIGNGQGMSWRLAVEFGSTQVPEAVRCVGITPQYRPRIDTVSSMIDHFMLRPIRERAIFAGWPTTPATAVRTSAVIRDNIRYSVFQAGSAATSQVVVIMYNLLTGETRTVDVTARSAGLTGTLNRSIGVAFDSPRVYLMAHSATANQRRVFEFADDSFETLLNTYDFSNQATNITNACFAVFGDYFFSMNNNGMERGNFRSNAAQTVHNHAACPYNTTITSGTARYITIRDGKFYTRSVYSRLA